MKIVLIVLAAMAVAGCSSVNVGVPLPIPGPIKPYVGANFSKSGVSGHAGASTHIGSLPIHVGGTSETIKWKKK